MRFEDEWRKQAERLDRISQEIRGETKIIINFTPHPVTITKPGGEEVIFSPEENPVRLREEITEGGSINGIPLVRKKFSGGDDFPPERDGVMYIVSLPVAQEGARLGRQDFLVPDGLVRDENGGVVGCRRLAVLA
jgi:hypothetical protein